MTFACLQLLVACGRAVESLSFAPRRLFTVKGKEIRSLSQIKDGMKLYITDGGNCRPYKKEERCLSGGSVSRYSERIRLDIIKGNKKKQEEDNEFTKSFRLAHQERLVKNFYNDRFKQDHLRWLSAEERMRREASLRLQEDSMIERSQTARTHVQDENLKLRSWRQKHELRWQKGVSQRISELASPPRSPARTTPRRRRTDLTMTAPAALGDQATAEPRIWAKSRNEPYVPKLLPKVFR